MKKLLLILILSLTTMTFSSEGVSSEDKFLGYWIMKDGNFILKIEKNDNNEFVGHTVWLKNETFPEGDKDVGKIQSDRNNPVPTLRDRPVLGLQIVGKLKLDGEKLTDGWVYDSWNGKMYHGSAKVSDENTLKLKGSLDSYGILGYTMKAFRVPTSDYAKYSLK